MNVYKEVVGILQEGVAGLVMAEESTKLAKSLALLNLQMTRKQNDALKAILAINVDSQLAIDSSRVVVNKLKNICDTIIFFLDAAPDKDGLSTAIKMYFDESKLLDPHVDKAIDKLTKVSNESVKGISC